MGIMMVATIFDGRKHLGFRLIDIQSRQVRDVSYSSVKNLLVNGGSIENLKITSGDIETTSNNILEYPKIDNGELVGKSSVTVLDKCDNGKYLVCTWEGHTIQLSEDILTSLDGKAGLTNCKVVHVPHGGGSKIIEKKLMLAGQTYDDVLMQFKEENKQKYIMSNTKAKTVNSKLGILGSGYHINENLELEVANKNSVSDTVIKIPEIVKMLPNECFSQITSLTEVIGGGDLQEIGQMCFSGCSNLTKVDFSDTKLQYIPYSAFHRCIKLQELYLPESIKTIGPYAFYHCGLTSVKIPENTKQILDTAFSQNRSLESIEWNEEIKTIGERAFSRTAIRELIIPDSVTTIDTRAFGYCLELRYVYIPESVKTLSYDFLAGSSVNLELLEIPKRLYTKPLRNNLAKRVLVKTY